jgi:hypothetical protein
MRGGRTRLLLADIRVTSPDLAQRLNVEPVRRTTYARAACHQRTQNTLPHHAPPITTARPVGTPLPEEYRGP